MLLAKQNLHILSYLFVISSCDLLLLRNKPQPKKGLSRHHIFQSIFYTFRSCLLEFFYSFSFSCFSCLVLLHLYFSLFLLLTAQHTIDHVTCLLRWPARTRSLQYIEVESKLGRRRSNSLVLAGWLSLVRCNVLLTHREWRITPIPMKLSINGAEILFF